MMPLTFCDVCEKVIPLKDSQLCKRCKQTICHTDTCQCAEWTNKQVLAFHNGVYWGRKLGTKCPYPNMPREDAEPLFLEVLQEIDEVDRRENPREFEPWRDENLKSFYNLGLTKAGRRLSYFYSGLR